MGKPTPIIATAVQKTYEAWLRPLPATTRRAYETDLKAFSKHRKDENVFETLVDLLQVGPEKAHDVVESYLKKKSKGFAQASVRRYASSLRAFVAEARKRGLVMWDLRPVLPRPETKEAAKATERRVKAVVTPQDMRAVRAALENDGTMVGLRDRVVIEMLATAPLLRREELASLDIGDIQMRDAETSALKVVGKGRTERETVPISPFVFAALDKWLQVRGGTRKSPLLIRLDPAKKKGAEDRINSRSIHSIVRARFEAIGVRGVHPHALRHYGATCLADAAATLRVPFTDAMAVTRHRDLETFAGYLDLKGQKSRALIKAVSSFERDPSYTR